MVCEDTRRIFSLLGDGDTGSPRSRFRALETAFTGDEGRGRAYFRAVAEDVLSDCCLGGERSGEGLRPRKVN